MDRDRVHVVMGTCGEYSYRSEWPVAAYANEEWAKRHVVLAGAAANEIHVRIAMVPEGENHYSACEELIHSNPYDHDMRHDYTGTSYYYMTVTVKHEPPPEREA